MTCIIGFVDKKNDCVWMGADSLGSNGYTKSVNTQPKVFHHDIFKNVVMGSTTTFRHIDLLKYSENLFPEVDWPVWTAIIPFISAVLIAAICVLLSLVIKTGEYRYECIIDDSVSYNEVVENYKIVEQRGDIWVLEDK